MSSQRNKWDARYRDALPPHSADAREVLRNYVSLLPQTGRALDLACGLGANALFMAEHGLSVEAWDISAVALEKLSQHARQLGLDIQTREIDVEQQGLGDACFDVIVVSRFLYRPLLPALANALKPGGLLFYQTFNEEKLPGNGPDKPDFLLRTNELPNVFAALTLRAYQELGQTGEAGLGGNRQETLYVGQKVVAPAHIGQ